MIIGDPYVDGINDPQIKELLYKGLKGLEEELEFLFDKTDWAREYLSEYNEQSFVGLFNNAVVRESEKGDRLFF